jgi:hypothetical protein
MIFTFTERPSDSPSVEKIWRTESERTGEFLSIVQDTAQRMPIGSRCQQRLPWAYHSFRCPVPWGKPIIPRSP